MINSFTIALERIGLVALLVSQFGLPQMFAAAELAVPAVQSAPASPGVASSERAAEPDALLAHWAFRPVVRPAVPPRFGAPGSNPIDAFIAARLAEQKLGLSPPADRVTLLRRLYLVMLGLPPAPEEAAAFLQDRAPDAFERWVDKVLADPRYGERWGRHWLDVIRFAESNGFETNRERPNAWRFRDYVIAAFNRDTPYDRFIREQLAGDALGVDVATGFLVGGPVDIVGSPDPVLTLQQRADELDDMVSTTGTAFLGLTLGCARCHAHKFDPIAHSEYYAMSAMFAGVKHGERGLPAAPSQQDRVAQLDRRAAELRQKLEQFLPKPFPTGELARVQGRMLRPAVNAIRNEETFAPVETRSLRFTIEAASGGEPCLDELEAWAGGGNVALTTHGTKATASGTLPGYEIHKLEHLNDGQVGNSHSWISSESGRGWVQLEFPRPERIERVVWGRDREGKFADRIPTRYRIEAATDRQTWQLLASSEDREPFPDKAGQDTGPKYQFENRPADEATQGRRWLAELEQVGKDRAIAARTPMVYAGTFTQPGPAYRLHRGDPMQKREAVSPGTLALFHPLALGTNTPEQERRLQLADWVARADHPLTARVLVNRVWQHHFGVGLVSTPNDFGRNGARPTHPELLDWLAAEFVAHGWSIKALQRQILTSAAWQQSSAPRPEGFATDAADRLLWRFPPRRLEAEAIRDSILAVSGNLDASAGGPPFFLHHVERENVYHYHPKETFGPGESRRMIYAFKVRMEQDGVFGAFDCPDGSLVTPRRSVSTTPLQALNLFNSAFILQEADTFARRLRADAGVEVAAQVGRAWQLAFTRPPTAAEAADAVAFAGREGMPALCRALLNASELMFIP